MVASIFRVVCRFVRRISVGRVAPAGVLVVAIASSACMEPGVYGSFTTWGFTANHFEATDQGFLDAVRASARRDLGCSTEPITARRVAEKRFAAEGCGQHVQYTAEPFGDDGDMWKLAREVVATDGRSFPSAKGGWLDAVRASGAHDLHCGEVITAREIPRYRASSEYMAEGCGRRATYESDPHELLLSSIVTITPIGP